MESESLTRVVSTKGIDFGIGTVGYLLDMLVLKATLKGRGARLKVSTVESLGNNPVEEINEKRNV